MMLRGFLMLAALSVASACDQQEERISRVETLVEAVEEQVSGAVTEVNMPPEQDAEDGDPEDSPET